MNNNQVSNDIIKKMRLLESRRFRSIEGLKANISDRLLSIEGLDLRSIVFEDNNNNIILSIKELG